MKLISQKIRDHIRGYEGKTDEDSICSVAKAGYSQREQFLLLIIFIKEIDIILKSKLD